MSQISRELQEQQDKDIGKAFEKIFGDIPTIDKTKEKIRFLNDRIAEAQEKARAESEKR